jgi:hypothetical protein
VPDHRDDESALGPEGKRVWGFALRSLWLTVITFISLCFDLLQFPFFCSDREYIIARRIWKLGGAYYCVTKVKWSNRLEKLLLLVIL